MKADEIRRLIINDLFLNMDDDDAEDTLERIDEYATEVSRERAMKFFKDTAHRPEELDIPTIEELYNDWIKEQEGV